MGAATIAVTDENFQSEVLDSSLPAPRASRATHWSTDPYSLGSYSYIHKSAKPSDMEALAQPVAGRVLFAGEATYFDYLGTVHGAMMSGMREAERLGADPYRLPGQY